MYDHLFFDADGTLFDFVAAQNWALYQVFTEFGIPANEDALQTYSDINAGVWLEFEQGLISIRKLKTERFRRFFDRYQVTGNPETCAEEYMKTLGRSYHLYDDVLTTLDTLQQRGIPMSMITNGLSSVQRGRLEATGTAHYFKAIIISEEIGVQKPHRSYFSRALEMAEEAGFPSKHPLIIGDSPTSDIQGGLNAHIDTCWINRFSMEADPAVPANYEVSNLHQFMTLLDNLD
jgi:putative hydrolase of the HAD superfamily